MLRWSGGMLGILSSFFLSPHSSPIILVDLCLICQHDIISLALLKLFFFLFVCLGFSFLYKPDLVLQHISGTLLKRLLICWCWHRPTYFLDVANCCEGDFLGFLSYLPHWSPCFTGSFAIAELTSAFLFRVLVEQFMDTGLNLGECHI